MNDFHFQSMFKKINLYGLMGILILLMVWELSARWIWQDIQVLPSPIQCMDMAWQVLTVQELLMHIATSLSRILIGFTFAAVIGVGLGIAVGWYQYLGLAFKPILELLRPIPPLAWIPMAIVWFGLGESSKWFVIFLGSFFPIFTNAWRGMVGIPPVILRAAQTMDVKGFELLLKVAIPAALPDIATGLRVAFGLAFGILVAAELIASDSGLGYLIMQSRETSRLGVAIFGILLIGLLSMLADGILARLLKKFVSRGRY
ncbi:MAG: ABC transporter permease [Betaproteobacteria bacterium]|nr:ABC transporter permease [Betaproteobacteria bacterium]